MERIGRTGEPSDPIGLGGGDLGRDMEAQLRQARSGGAKLPPAIRASMEHAMGADFGEVRVHAGPQADALSRSMQARAFTAGRDIFFARSQFRPERPAGSGSSPTSSPTPSNRAAPAFTATSPSGCSSSE